MFSRFFLSLFVILITNVPSFAQTTVSTSDITTQLTTNGTAIVAVGGAVAALAAVAMVFRWLKAAMFG